MIKLLPALLLAGCMSNPQLKRVLDDLGSTPVCDNKNVLTSPKDTKDTLKAKVIILNYKLDCHVDYTTYQNEKIDSYKELNRFNFRRRR